MQLRMYSTGTSLRRTILPMYTSGIIHPIHRLTATHSVAYYTFLNDVVHFAQNITAFIILASVSPVTYSIASLFKRAAVICITLV
jgi:solute carrier family 35 protein E1